MSDDITTGEVVRRLDRFEKTTADAFKELGQKLDSMNVVYRDVYEADQKLTAEKFERIEERLRDQKSRARALLDGVAFPVLVAVIVAVGAFLATGAAHIGG